MQVPRNAHLPVPYNTAIINTLKNFYRPSVCRQNNVVHTHYDILMLKPDDLTTNLIQLQQLSRKIGGETAGQVITLLLELIGEKFDLSIYGIDRLHVENLPLYEVCHKGESDSPTLDWDLFLFDTPFVQSILSNPNCPVGHIKH